MTSTTMLALGGSRRAASLTNAVLHAATDLACTYQARATCLTLPDLPDLGFFDPDNTTTDDQSVHQLLTAVRTADAVLLGTPIYGGTPSGAVKNLLDVLHLDKAGDVGPLSSKRVALVSVGGGGIDGRYFFQRGACATLDVACKNLGAWVDPQYLELSELHFGLDGRLLDALGRDALRRTVVRLLGLLDGEAEQRRTEHSVSGRS